MGAAAMGEGAGRDGVDDRRGTGAPNAVGDDECKPARGPLASTRPCVRPTPCDAAIRMAMAHGLVVECPPSVLATACMKTRAAPDATKSRRNQGCARRRAHEEAGRGNNPPTPAVRCAVPEVSELLLKDLGAAPRRHEVDEPAWTRSTPVERRAHTQKTNARGGRRATERAANQSGRACMSWEASAQQRGTEAEDEERARARVRATKSTHEEGQVVRRGANSFSLRRGQNTRKASLMEDQPPSPPTSLGGGGTCFSPSQISGPGRCTGEEGAGSALKTHVCSAR